MKRPFLNSQVSKQEWQWVAFWGGFFTLLTMLPYVIATLANNHEWHFFGILSDTDQSVNHLAQMRQGREGSWLFDLRYTPETNQPVGLFVFYTFLGHVARIFGLSEIIVFHLARVGSSLFMFSAFYHFGSSVWVRIRPRRLFFGLVSVSSGLGWLILLIFPRTLATDLRVPTAFPLYAAYINPHYPLALGCLALLASFFIQVFRPGNNEAPKLENGGLAIILLSLITGIVFPSALIGFATALAIFIIITAYLEKEFPWHEMRWAAMLWSPALPLAFYMFSLVRSNDVIRQFAGQIDTPTPNIFLFLVGYGILLFIAAPGIYRATRHFERDGDQFMFVWLVLTLVIVSIPSSLQGRLLTGLIIPITFFVVRAIEDYWLERIPSTRRVGFIIGIFVLLMPSNILALGIPMYGVVFSPEDGAASGIVVTQDYYEAMVWLDENGIEDEVVLASPNVSAWIPANTDLSVVYGHPFETIPAKKRRDQVHDFFRGDDCITLLSNNEGFTVDYVLWGPSEDDLANETEDSAHLCQTAIYQYIEYSPSTPLEDECTDTSNRIRCFGDVRLYVLRELR